MTLRGYRLAVLFRVWLASAWLAVALLLVPVRARAANEDKEVRETVQQVMNEDYPGSLGPAKKKLNDLVGSCARKGCSAAVKAEVYVALGMVSSQLGSPEDAKANFKLALQNDPNAKLPANPTPNIKKEWEEVAGASAKVAPAGGGEEQPGAEEPQGVGGQIKLIKEALDADQAGKLDECIDKDRQALKLGENARTRLHLASCESRSGKLVDALNDARKSLESGINAKDTAVMKVARTRVTELLARIPHVTFVPPPGVGDLKVTFDDRPVPADALTKKFSIDPGKHTVSAEGTVNGFSSTFNEEYEIKEKEFITVRITLKPPTTSDIITPSQIKCMLQAKSQEEVQKCLPQNQKSIVIRVAADLSGYSDTNSVAVYTPAINASVTSPTAGWNVGANFLLDAVSAASPDLVSTASPPFKEYRYGAGVTGGYKPGLYGGQVNGSVSTSPDYVSYTVGGQVTVDLNEKLITPSFGYTFSLDHIGRGPNNYLHDFNPLKGLLYTHEINAGVTFIISPTAIALIGGTVTVERGDQSQPYRYIPMFDPDNIAPFVPNGATVDLVNRTRLPIKPLEQLPTDRIRVAAGGRFNKRLGNSTFRIEERLYFDTWGVKASSTDSRYMVDLSRHLRVWPHARLHAQTGANFYKLAYGALLTQADGIVIPTFRTADRELSPLVTGTGGGGARIALGEPEGEVKYAITVVGDVMYTRYFQALYVTARTAVYGAVGFDVEF